MMRRPAVAAGAPFAPPTLALHAAMMRSLRLALLSIFLASPALAGTEEWSTFGIVAQEQDDESQIDHLMSRPPLAWREEWARMPQGLRTSQGCLTSGQWMVATDLKAQAPLGERARLGVAWRDVQDDRAAFTYFDLGFRFPTARGTLGFLFRPFHDKSRQDLGLFWETGAETTAVEARATFTFEDVFNDLWAFRQTKVGGTSEPYERHPFEPALRVVLRPGRARIEVEGQYLTPSRQRLVPDTPLGVPPRATLWGTWGRVQLEREALGSSWGVLAENRQARSARSVAGTSDVLGDDFRRQWSGELWTSRRFGDRIEAEGRWVYQERAERSNDPYPSRVVDAVDRALQVEARWRFAGGAVFRLGGLYDRITLGATGAYFPTYGTRNESRAYFGLAARFGRVSMTAVEGIEMDPEPYDVWGVHDKAFVNLQTAF